MFTVIKLTSSEKFLNDDLSRGKQLVNILEHQMPHVA